MKVLVLALSALAVVVTSTDNKRYPHCPHCVCHGHCEDGWTYYKKTDACYKVYLWNNFDNAENVCTTKGGHLASIHSSEENKFVKELAETGIKGDSHKKGTWIGLKQARYPQSKEWTWTDGTAVDYPPPWAPNQPDDNGGREHCTQVFSDIMSNAGFKYQTWNDCPCGDMMRAFVCKKKASHNP